MILRLLNKSNKIPVKSTETGIIYSMSNGALRIAAKGSHWKVIEIDGRALTDGDVVNVLSIDAHNCCTLIVEKT